MEEIGIINFNL